MTELSYSTKLSHHDFDTMQVTIERSESRNENIVDVRVFENSISFTKQELEEILSLFEKYNKASQYLTGE